MKIKSLLSLVLVFAMAFSFVACDILFIEGEDSDSLSSLTFVVESVTISESSPSMNKMSQATNENAIANTKTSDNKDLIFIPQYLHPHAILRDIMLLY